MGDAVWLPGHVYTSSYSTYVNYMVVLLDDFVVGLGAPILAFPPSGVSPSYYGLKPGRNDSWGNNYKAKTTIQYEVWKRRVR